MSASPTCSVAGSCIRKRKSSPCGPYFPGTFRSMDAVRKEGQLDEAFARHSEAPFHQSLGRDV